MYNNKKHFPNLNLLKMFTNPILSRILNGGSPQYFILTGYYGQIRVANTPANNKFFEKAEDDQVEVLSLIIGRNTSNHDPLERWEHEVSSEEQAVELIKGFLNRTYEKYENKLVFPEHISWEEIGNKFGFKFFEKSIV